MSYLSQNSPPPMERFCGIFWQETMQNTLPVRMVGVFILRKWMTLKIAKYCLTSFIYKWC